MVRDLYAMHFAPSLSGRDLLTFAEAQTPSDIAEEQRHIAWADRVTFIYPLWWSAMPAMLKGYVDRVFAEGFAFSFGETGLKELACGEGSTGFYDHGHAGGALRGERRKRSPCVWPWMKESFRCAA